jgi:hypothetical protein
MTLSNKISDPDMTRLAREAEMHFKPFIGAPMLIDAVTIFCEDEPGAPFRAEESFALRGSSENAWPEIWKLGVR